MLNSLVCNIMERVHFKPINYFLEKYERRKVQSSGRSLIYKASDRTYSELEVALKATNRSATRAHR